MIQRNLNAIIIDLERPENKELADLIDKEVRYAATQVTQYKEYLIKSTVQRLIKIFNEYPLMIDGRNDQSNNNNEPF